MATSLLEKLREINDPLLVLHVGQRFNQERIDGRVNRGRGADTQGQRKHCDPAECRCFYQHPRRVSQIAEHVRAIDVTN